MRATYLLLQALPAAAWSPQINRFLSKRQSSCANDVGPLNTCADQASSVQDCQDAVCGDSCYTSDSSVASCCENYTGQDFATCLVNYLDSLAPTVPADAFSSEPGLASFTNAAPSSFLGPQLTPTPTFGSGSGSSGSSGCSVVSSAVNACITGDTATITAPLVELGQCFCDTAGPSNFDQALVDCIDSGGIALPNASMYGSSFCFNIGAGSASATPFSSMFGIGPMQTPAMTSGIGGIGGGGIGGGPVPTTTRPALFSTPASESTTFRLTPQASGGAQSLASTSTARITNPAAQGGNGAPPLAASSSTAGAYKATTPADWLSLLTAMALAALGI